MKKIREMIPKPKSLFIKVKCPECGNEQTTFNKASSKVFCNVCNTLLTEPTGGEVTVKGAVIEELG